MKSFRKAEIYARQKGTTRKGPGWGYRVTPRQRRRLERTHTKDMRLIAREVWG